MIGEEVIAVYGDAGDGEELFEVQKLVRCKECIDFVYDDQYKCYGCANDKGLMGEIKPDDFCSHGEREASDE